MMSMTTRERVCIIWGDALEPYEESNGIYTREFENGFVICNANSGGGKISVDLPAGTFYKLKGSQDPFTNDGQSVSGSVSVSNFSGIVLVKDPAFGAGVNKRHNLANSFWLRQISANPFGSSTTLQFHIPQAAGQSLPVDLSIYDINGRMVKNLISHSQIKGTHEISWRGKDEEGRIQNSGLYLYKLTAGNYVFVRKLVMVR